jgi:superfamily II DNA or RNA helicase
MGRVHVQSVQQYAMEPPFMVEYQGRLAVIETNESGLLGTNRWSGWLVDSPSENVNLSEPEIVLYQNPTDGVEGSILRFLLTERRLARTGMGRMTLGLRANIDFSPFQLRPLLKFFQEAERRLLIADETGLGKTIEAGMILAEVLAEKRNSTCIVILCPASVRRKWKRELKQKFGISAHLSNFKKFNEYGVPPGIHIISQGADASAESITIPKNSLDLLIIDEIHNFIGRTDGQKRRGRAQALSEASNAAIGLSATPIQIELEDLHRILTLIAPNEHPANEWRQQVELQTAINRIMRNMNQNTNIASEDIARIEKLWQKSIETDINVLRGPLNSEHKASLSLKIKRLGPIGRRMTRARARDPDVALAKVRHVSTTVVLLGERRELIHDMLQHLSENHAFAHVRQFVSCPAAAISILKTQGDTSENANRLRTLLHEHMPNKGPKVKALLQLLKDHKLRDDITKTVVFTHWLPTFTKLAAVLKSSGIHAYYVQPNITSKEADEIIERFRSVEGYAVLLATDRMSEGVDLEMANAMVNMDLPYNPARLQQRIGRLDRYTQTSSFIEVVNLVLEDTYEIEQIDVLNQRMEVFERIIGGYEQILSSDEEEIFTPSVGEDLAKKTADIMEFAESNVVVRVIDTAMDGQINKLRQEVNTIHSRLYEIVQAAFESLGVKLLWDPNLQTLTGSPPIDLVKRLLKSNLFVSEGTGRLRATLEQAINNGKLVFSFGGRNATFGPFSSFLEACEKLLSSKEEVEKQRVPMNYEIIKNRYSDHWVITENKTEMSNSKILEMISERELNINSYFIGENCVYGW